MFLADREKTKGFIPSSTETASRLQGLSDEPLYVRASWKRERAKCQPARWPPQRHEGSICRARKGTVSFKNAACSREGEIGSFGGARNSSGTW